MRHLGANAVAGEFCWVDLATRDAARAGDFYNRLFGWVPSRQPANGGCFTRLQMNGRDVASLYQLHGAQVDAGLPSHWTPYVRVRQIETAVSRALALGAEPIVRPFAISGIARIALIADPDGALLGLLEPMGADQGEAGDDA